MERLTKNWAGEIWPSPANGKKHADYYQWEWHDNIVGRVEILGKLAAYEDSGLTPERALELAKAEAEGRLVVLPCKVGGTVYIIDVPDCKSGECPDVDTAACSYERFNYSIEKVEDCLNRHKLVREIEVDEIKVSVEENELLYELNDYLIVSAEGIFLTRSEAEAALAERKGGD